MYFVYALWSVAHDKIYVGFSENPDQRLLEHNQGKSSYTKSYRSWERFYLEKVNSRREALKKEIYLKSGWGRKKLKQELEKWQSGRMRQS